MQQKISSNMARMIIIMLVMGFMLISIMQLNKKSDKILTQTDFIIGSLQRKPAAARYSFEPKEQATIKTTQDFFLLEPQTLVDSLSESDIQELINRFDLPLFSFDSNCVTVGTFGDDAAKTAHFASVNGLTLEATVQGKHPFTNENFPLHRFYTSERLRVHLVVLHRVKHFLWIGKIPTTVISKFASYNLHFGLREQIFEPFEIDTKSEVNMPSDVYQFLSEISTSRYLHCPPERTKWLDQNKVHFKPNKVKASNAAIVSFKAMMKELKMQFWVACGTLLGWYRQCQVTPYTTDTDFASWSKYLNGEYLTKTFKSLTRKHKLKLTLRFGEPNTNLEYSFESPVGPEKVDLFFVYSNKTHFKIPTHVPPMYAFAEYPIYTLCSMELLGHKLLAPCDPELIIKSEYGPKWRDPVTNWNYLRSPFNMGPDYDFPANITQLERF